MLVTRSPHSRVVAQRGFWRREWENKRRLERDLREPLGDGHKPSGKYTQGDAEEKESRPGLKER